MSIKRRLHAVILLVTLTALVQASLGVVSSFFEKRGLDELSLLTSISSSALRIQLALLEHRRFEKDIFLNINDAPRKESYFQRFQAQEVAIKRLAADLLQTELEPHESEQVRTILRLHDQYLKNFHKVY
jgi:hypothetical protein